MTFTKVTMNVSSVQTEAERKQEHKEVELLNDILPWADGSVEEIERVKNMAEEDWSRAEERRRKERKVKETLLMEIEKEMERRELTA